MHSKYNVSTRYYDEIWGDSLLRCKTAKFFKRLLRVRKRRYLPRWKRFLNFNITYRLRLKFPKTAYGKLMIHKQKVRKFYNHLTESQFRQLFIRGKKHSSYWIQHFYYQLERRIDTLLYRLNFVPTVSKGKQLIIRGNTLINGHKSQRPSITLTLGDTFQLLNFRKLRLKLRRKLRKRRIFMFYPAYFEVNYKTFTAIMFTKPQGGQIFFPFHFNQSKLANFYRTL